ncbi:unnamed protein product, partial [Nesidiocoris tenuis]
TNSASTKIATSPWPTRWTPRSPNLPATKPRLFPRLDRQAISQSQAFPKPRFLLQAFITNPTLPALGG